MQSLQAVYDAFHVQERGMKLWRIGSSRVKVQEKINSKPCFVFR